MSYLSELIVLFFALSVILPTPSLTHPQCLDFQPPYQDSQVSYCTEYSDFGCCWRVTDRRARKRVNHLLTRTRAGRQVSDTCEPYLRNVSCTHCSPYASHLFDIEDSAEGRTFPWLCRDYCEETYQNCQRVLLRMYKMKTSEFGLAKNPRSRERLINDSITFCSQVVPTESPYCYPRVLNGPQIGDGRPQEPTGNLSCLCALPVASGLRNPVFAVHSSDQTGRMFLGEQVGVVSVLTANNTLLKTPFLDIQSKVLTSRNRGDERGMLGMAFHPNYKENGRFFVYYSLLLNNRHYSRVSEFSVNQDDSNVADPNSEKVIFNLLQPRSNHNGGQLLFKDGYLLVFFGDGGGAGDRFGSRGNGQNKATWLGSVIRIDIDHKDLTRGTEYSIPSDNPFVNETNAAPEIYAYGLRNPWRCSLDRGDRVTGEGRGRIFCGDVGQNRFEEVDIIEQGGNYGWRAYEGDTCFDSNLCSDTKLGDVISPIDVYDHQSVGVSVTGGYVYRGCLFPNLRGLYVYGDYGTGTLLALREDDRSWHRTRLCMGDGNTCTGDLVGQERKRFVLSFGEDEDGELYVLTTSNASPTRKEGVVYQIIDPSRRTRPIECKRNIKKLNFKG